MNGEGLGRRRLLPVLWYHLNTESALSGFQTCVPAVRVRLVTYPMKCSFVTSSLLSKGGPHEHALKMLFVLAEYQWRVQKLWKQL